MNCQFDEMLLYEYLDDTLSKADKLLVNNHLSCCSHCRKTLSEIKLMYYELDQLEEVEVPVEMAAIRNAALEAFDGKTTTLESVANGIKKTKETLLETPVINHMIPTKEKLSRTSKAIYQSSKKIIASKPKEEKPKKAKKRLGGLI